MTNNLSASESSKHIHSICARIYLRESRARSGKFAITLQLWAANQRRKYHEAVRAERAQMGLF